jgi:hypothetical protein
MVVRPVADPRGVLYPVLGYSVLDLIRCGHTSSERAAERTERTQQHDHLPQPRQQGDVPQTRHR